MRYVRVCDTMLHFNTLLHCDKTLFINSLIEKKCPEEGDEKTIPDRIIFWIIEKENHLIQSSRYALL